MVRATRPARIWQAPLDFLDLVTEVIDLRSFSNLWYWIVLAIMWSTLSHWTLGVPYHLVQRARRGDARALEDATALARINGARLLLVTRQAGPFLAGVATLILTSLAITGWVYGAEFSQAVFLLLFPAILVGTLTASTARKLAARDFEDVPGALRLHRLFVQILGVLFIFITAFWGMYQNVTVGPLG